MRTGILLMVLFIGWSTLFWYHYVFRLHNSSNEIVAENAPTDGSPLANSQGSRQHQEETAVIIFNKTAYKPVLNIAEDQLLDSLLQMGSSGQILQITGFYTVEEQEGLAYDLGYARASEIKKILMKAIPEDQIEVFSDTFQVTTAKEQFSEAVQIRWVDDYHVKTESESELESEPESEFAVKDYYLLQHDEKYLKPEAYEDLLSTIAERLAQSGEKVIIRGHTDSSGDSKYDFNLSLRNAKNIRDFFKERGVSHQQIIPTAEGDDNPIATNETEAGRLKNRRIEIQIQNNTD